MITRTLYSGLDEIIAQFPALIITGPRQVGKSTLLENFHPEKFNHVTLDNLYERNLAKSDPEFFLQAHQPPLFIDEIQYAPNLLSYIKIYIDTHRGEKGLFLLTGSQKFALMQGVQESLAGRVAVLDLLGFSMSEKLGEVSSIPFLPSEGYIENLKVSKRKSKTVREVYKDIWQGSFPAAQELQDDKARKIFYDSYIQTYIERDVRELIEITDIGLFHKFIQCVAARTGQLVDYRDLARNVDITDKTAKAWLTVLQRSGLVYLLSPYYNNVTQRIIKTPKLYFLDTGLCAHLTRWTTAESLEAGAMSGAILETYCFSEILKSYWHNALQPNIYFYRYKNQNEIDFIIEENGTLYPIEVKKTVTPSPFLEKGFQPIKKLGLNIAKSVVLSMCPKVMPLTREVVCIPIGLI